MKRLILRPGAERDFDEQTRHLVQAGGYDLGERFTHEAEAALRLIRDAPGIGSPLVGELSGIDGLRRTGIDGFPHGWLYIERTDLIDVVRLLADRQDIGAVEVYGGSSAAAERAPSMAAVVRRGTA